MQGGKITKVTILQQPNGNRQGAEINDQALPILIDETSGAEREDRHGQRRDGDQRGLRAIAASRHRRGRHMSSTAVTARADGRIQRRVEHLMGMPISLALRGRHAASAAGRRGLAGGDRSATARRRDLQHLSARTRSSTVSIVASSPLRNARPRWPRCSSWDEKPSESPAARSQSSFPQRDGRRRLDPSGVVKGWAAQRASQFLACFGRHRLLPLRRWRHRLPHRRPESRRVANRYRAPT